MGYGQSNVRYVRETDEGQKFVQLLRAYTENPSTIDVPAKSYPGTGVPRQSDPVQRIKVEKAAIECVIEHYKNYECVSVERENKGWDLEFTRGSVHLLVEVKGCSGHAAQVELTPNEYDAMRHHRDWYRLAIVTSALDSPELSIISFNESDNTWRNQYGRKVRLNERIGAQVTF